MTAEERAHAIWDIFKCGDGERIQRIAGLIRAAEEIAYRRALEEAAQLVGRQTYVQSDAIALQATLCRMLAEEIRGLDKTAKENNTKRNES